MWLRYLDGIVTVSVGRCHPRATNVAVEQLRTLAHTTTIYLHSNIARYAEKLVSKMPGELSVCYFVNSGSEANDLVLLMARLHTGYYDVIALRTWKHSVPMGFGIHHAKAPNPYRGPYGHDDPDAGRKYAADV